MWLTHRNRKSSHRPRRTVLLVEQLEWRELLSGSPVPAPPPAAPPPAAPAIVTLPANALPAGARVPAGVALQPARGWQTAGASAFPGVPPTNGAAHVQTPLLYRPLQSPTPAGEGYTPAQMRQAYGFNQIALPAGKTFDDAGSGQTIAIIDSYDDPNITTDLQTFDQTFSIGGTARNPASTAFFKVVNQSGGNTLPATDSVDNGLEISLDVEWAHAMAPGANILLVEADSQSPTDLDTAIEFAARQPGVSVISMSFGGYDEPTDYYNDNLFTTPLGHAGVAFIASAGDSGGTNPSYPAMSPNVLSVGGTTLPANASGNPSRALEYSWSLGGGGISNGEAEPAYQLGVQSTGLRTNPDLAFNADLNTGVAVYDTLLANEIAPGNPWFEVGGTSAGAPQISALVAIADQLRAAAHEAPLDGANQLLPAIYQIAATDPHAFQDITSGNNGFAAGPGYDLATGLGTPNAQYLVPDLVAAYATPPASRTIYWTGDVNTNWDTPGNWSTVDPAKKNVQQSILPAAADRVIVDIPGAVIRHDGANYDTISRLTVTATKVTLDLGGGTLDLSGGGKVGTFQVDQNGDTVTLEAGVLAHADVTAHTTLAATSATLGFATVVPELVGVQLDGTLNASQSGQDNGFYVTSNLVLNGTVNLGGNKDLSSVLLAGFYDPYLGSQDNNPETISGSGTIQLGHSKDDDALYNWGTTGTFTIGPHITVRGGGAGSIGLFAQSPVAGSLDNQGTLVADGGTFVIQASSPFIYGHGPATAPGWTNEGTIAATGGATLALLGAWRNSGTISLDGCSTVLLGNVTSGQLADDAYAYRNVWSSSGMISIADGATVYLGGFLTADEYQGASAIPGVRMHPAADVLYLDGTLDNLPADNPITRGALNTSSAPLMMAGGTIIGGALTTGSEVRVLFVEPLPGITDDWLGGTSVAASDGWLDNVTNNGTVTDARTFLFLSNVTNNGTVSGKKGATVAFQNAWANTGIIKVDGTSSLYLGRPALNGFVYPPPTLADGSAFAWDPHAIGTIHVADGATVGIGGLLTTDLFMALPSLPGVHIHPTLDTYFLDGWLDNRPADNPVTGGVLALTSATGPLNVAGGLISGGTIVSTGTGALDFGSIGGFVSLYRSVLDSVTNNGAINITSSALLYLEGTITNNGTMATSNGSIFMMPGGGFTNNGTMTISSGGDGFGAPVTNNGTITVTQGGFNVSAPAPAIALTNNGSISLTSSFLFADSTINSGVVTANTQSSAEFEGNYDNSHGIISVDSTSSLVLGRGTLQQFNFPTFADATPYTFDPTKVGTMQIADGATLLLGGLMTTDQMNAFPSLPGVSVHFARDRMVLWGWLDNSPADNPVSGGVLALTSAIGPLFLDGGYIYKGKITTSGPDDLEGSDIGILDGIELDGNLNVTTSFFGQVYVEHNLTLNGTIVMPGSQGFLYFGHYDDSPETITGTGSISMGTSSTYMSVLDNLSNTSLTIGSGITINAAAQFADFVAERSQTNVLGTVEDNTASSTLYTYGMNFDTFTPFQSLANLNGGTLTGGTWEFGNGATWRTYGADITTNAANLSISGAGTQMLDSVFDQGHNALAGLTTNAATGHLTVGAGDNLAVQGNFLNAGILEIAGTFTVQGNYTQTSGAALDIDIAGPTQYGSLTVSGTATLAGTLNVVLVNGYTPAPGASFPILTFGARAGDFSTENGLLFSPTEKFEADYLGNTLTLVVKPI